MRIAVTGAAGRVGGQVVELLLGRAPAGPAPSSSD